MKLIGKGCENLTEHCSASTTFLNQCVHHRLCNHNLFGLNGFSQSLHYIQVLRWSISAVYPKTQCLFNGAHLRLYSILTEKSTFSSKNTKTLTLNLFCPWKIEKKKKNQNCRNFQYCPDVPFSPNFKFCCFVHPIFSSFGFWYFGHFSCVIFFPVLTRLAHLALQNVNKDYIIFS